MLKKLEVVESIAIIINALGILAITIYIYRHNKRSDRVTEFNEKVKDIIELTYIKADNETQIEIKKVMKASILNGYVLENGFDKIFKNEYFIKRYKTEDTYCWFEKTENTIYFNKKVLQNCMGNVNGIIRKIVKTYLKIFEEYNRLNKSTSKKIKINKLFLEKMTNEEILKKENSIYKINNNYFNYKFKTKLNFKNIEKKDKEIIKNIGRWSSVEENNTFILTKDEYEKLNREINREMTHEYKKFIEIIEEANRCKE